jgi:N-acetylglutamate synthase-like GNAT family acetyltransferase
MMEEDISFREGTVMWNEDLEDKIVADMLSYLDAPAVRELLASTMGNPTPEQLDQVCTQYRTNPSYHLLGYQRKGMIIGCIGLQLSFPGSAIIRAIAVALTYRGQGIGSRLLRQSIETFSLAQLVAETDCDAVEFYRTCGFTISSLGEKYPGTERFLCSWMV